MTTINELQTEIDEVVEKFNPNHVPAGSPDGGQFTTGGGGSGTGDSFKKETGRSFGKGSKLVTISVDNDTGKDNTRWLEVTFAKEPSEIVQMSLKNVLDRGNTETRRQGDTFVMRFGANSSISETRVNLARQALHRGGHVKIPSAFFGGDITTEESNALFGVDEEIFRSEGRLKSELQEQINGVVEKFNPNHVPAGSPEGGQFTSASGTGGALGKGVKTVSATEEKKRVDAAGDVATKAAKEKAEARYVVREPFRAIISSETKPITDEEKNWTLFDNDKNGKLLVLGTKAEVTKRRHILVKTFVTRAKNRARIDELVKVQDERIGFF